MNENKNNSKQKCQMDSEDWVSRILLGETTVIRTSGTVLWEDERDNDFGVRDLHSTLRFVPRDSREVFVLLGVGSSPSCSLSVSIGSCEWFSVDAVFKRVLIVNAGSSSLILILLPVFVFQ